jgi:hypothetical protein
VTRLLVVEKGQTASIRGLVNFGARKDGVLIVSGIAIPAK